ncbi:MAG: peptidylprolyl isomerase [Alphaproteobacteria bacterium]|nr:peptidylprolyl isomerase [Alphaproteobacteria bacterium]
MSRMSAALAASLLGFALVSPVQALGEDSVAATVNGAEIRMSDVMRLKNGAPQLAQAPMGVVYPVILNKLIRDQLLAEAGRKDGLAKDADVVQALKNAETQIIAQTYAMRAATKGVTDQAVQARYSEMKKKFKPAEEVRARHILVNTSDEANGVLADIKNGKKFEEVAAEKSKDGNAQSGGDLGFFRKDEMVPEFAETAFKLKPGQVSAPVKTQFGWHVIKMEEKRMSQPPQLDEVKEDLQAQLAEEALSKIIKNLEAGAKISRFDAEGKPMQAPAAPHK